MHEETDGCLLLVSSNFLKKSAIGSDRAVSFLSGAEGKCDRLLSLLGLNVSSALNSSKKSQATARSFEAKYTVFYVVILVLFSKVLSILFARHHSFVVAKC